MRSRYVILLAIAALLLPVTACLTISPVPTPFLVFPSATVQPTVAPSATAMPAPPVATPGTPTLTPVPATAVPPTTAPQATTNPQPQAKRVSFPAGGTSATIHGTTATPGQDRFVIRALAGQTMSVNIASTQGPAIIIIYGADGDVLISDHAGATSWSGTLRTTQDSFIDTRSVGDAQVPFTLTVTIPPLGEAPTPTPKRISFAAGAVMATVQSTLAVNGIDRWVLRALAGQTMTANTSATQGQVILIIWGAQDGNVLISDHAGATSWTGKLPTTEDYYIDVRSVGNVVANYSLQVTIPPP